MAHVVMRRIRLVLVVALAGALAGLLPPAPASALPADDMVPSGHLLLQSSLTAETQRDAIAVDGKRHQLVQYLIPDPAIHDQVNGGIERQVTSLDLSLGIGLSDSWNLRLGIPYREIRQASTLHTSSTDATAQAAVDRLQTRTVSGIGNVKLESVHRPIFDDTDALQFIWGVTLAGRDKPTEFVGRTTLTVANPNDTVDGAIHYARYLLSVSHARIDLRGEFDLGIRTKVDTPTEKNASYSPFNRGTFELRWTQEAEVFGYSLFARHDATTQAFIGTLGLHDQTKETRLGFELLYGNLTELERHPLPLPYQASVQIDHLVLGYNTPETTRVTLNLRLYF